MKQVLILAAIMVGLVVVAGDDELDRFSVRPNKKIQKSDYVRIEHVDPKSGEVTIYKMKRKDVPQEVLDLKAGKYKDASETEKEKVYDQIKLLVTKKANVIEEARIPEDELNKKFSTSASWNSYFEFGGYGGWGGYGYGGYGGWGGYGGGYYAGLCANLCQVQYVSYLSPVYGNWGWYWQ